MAIILPRTFMAASYDILEANAAGAIRTKLIVANDNTISSVGTFWNEEKEFRFIRNTSEMNSTTLIIKSEVMASNGTTNMGIFMDLEMEPRIVLSTVGTGYELLQGTAYIGDLLDGVHFVNISLQNLNNGTYFQRLLEMHEKV